MIAFIHINKTGGSTFRRLLRSTFGTKHCDVEPWHAAWSDPPFSSDDLRRIRRLYPRLKSIAGHRLTGYVPLEEFGTRFEYVTVVRDPIRACASRFQYNVDYRQKRDLVFEDWIRKDWVQNYQTRRIAGVADFQVAVDIIASRDIFVGLTDRFDESIVMFKKLRAPELNISHRPVNVAADNTLTESLLSNDRTRSMIEAANEIDLRLIQFLREKWYPSFQEAYGPTLPSDVASFQQDRGEFDERNITLSRIKQYTLLKPLQALYRQPLTRSAISRLLG